MKLYFFHGSWCSSCKAMEPELDEAINGMGIECVKCSMDDEFYTPIAERFSVRSLPTLVLANDEGELVDLLVGYNGCGDIKELIDKYA